MQPVTINAGYVMRAWYDIKSLDIDRREDEAGVRASHEIVAALVARERSRGIDTGVSSSPGSRRARDGALHGTAAYAAARGIMALSTYVPVAASLASEANPANAGTPIFMAHAPRIPSCRTASARDRATSFASSAMTWSGMSTRCRTRCAPRRSPMSPRGSRGCSHDADRSPVKRVLLGGVALLLVAATGGALWLYARSTTSRSGPSSISAARRWRRGRCRPVSSRRQTVTARFSACASRTLRLPPPEPRDRGAHRDRDRSRTVAADVIVIRKLEVSAPAIVYETARTGANLDALKRTAARSARRLGRRRDGAKQKEQRLIVDRLAIRGGGLTYAPPSCPDPRHPARLPDIVLTNVGASRAASPRRAASVIVDAVVARTAQTIAPARIKSGIRACSALTDPVQPASRSITRQSSSS